MRGRIRECGQQQTGWLYRKRSEVRILARGLSSFCLFRADVHGDPSRLGLTRHPARYTDETFEAFDADFEICCSSAEIWGTWILSFVVVLRFKRWNIPCNVENRRIICVAIWRDGCYWMSARNGSILLTEGLNSEQGGMYSTDWVSDSIGCCSTGWGLLETELFSLVRA